MKNREKFWSIKERVTEFRKWCKNHRKLDRSGNIDCKHDCWACLMRWPDLEAEEEKLIPCPFCGAETRVEEYIGMDHKPHYRVVCDDCYMQSCAGSRKDVVEKYNRVARGVNDPTKKEVEDEK